MTKWQIENVYDDKIDAVDAAKDYKRQGAKTSIRKATEGWALYIAESKPDTKTRIKKWKAITNRRWKRGKTSDEIMLFRGKVEQNHWWYSQIGKSGYSIIIDTYRHYLEKHFKTKSQAVAYAKKWMKEHPNG